MRHSVPRFLKAGLRGRQRADDPDCNCAVRSPAHLRPETEVRHSGYGASGGGCRLVDWKRV